MSQVLSNVAFDDAHIGATLASLEPEVVDDLPFGIIGFDLGGIVRVYNKHEAAAAGLGAGRVLERSLFTEVAPCMNNYMVAQRFVDARASGEALDATIDYVLTLRMRPTRVALRLVQDAGASLGYVLVRRAAAGQ